MELQRPARADDHRSSSLEAVLNECRSRLERDGIVAALSGLNARTRFRFTGLYQADPPLLRNRGLFDRENPELDVSGEVKPFDETYCAITRETGLPFITVNSERDERLHDHPARGTVVSYAGVPLRLENGSVWGSLCHFDARPRLLPRAELRLLEELAPYVARWALAHR